MLISVIVVVISQSGVTVVLSISHIQFFWDPIDCSPPGSSVFGILQAKILEWVVVSFSRGSSPPRDRTSYIGRWILYHWAIENPSQYIHISNEHVYLKDIHSFFSRILIFTFWLLLLLIFGCAGSSRLSGLLSSRGGQLLLLWSTAGVAWVSVAVVTCLAALSRWNLPGPRMEPVSPVLVGRFLTTRGGLHCFLN